MDEAHCLLPWQLDLITAAIRVGVSAPKTYTADTYPHDEKGRRPGGWGGGGAEGSPSTSA